MVRIASARKIALTLPEATEEPYHGFSSFRVRNKVFATIPDDWATVSGAINLGEPLLSHSPKSKVRQSFQELAERLHTPEEPSDDNGERRKGLIGRIFATT